MNILIAEDDAIKLGPIGVLEGQDTAAALIEVACARACLALVRNGGASMPATGFDRLIARFRPCP